MRAANAYMSVMSLRSACLLAAVFSLLACSSDPASSGSTTSGSSSVSGPSLDGTWTITKLGEDEVGLGSQLAIANGVLTGTLIAADEGSTVDGCAVTKDRTDLTFAVNGDTLTGSLTATRKMGGSCQVDDSSVAHLTGTRTQATTGATGMNGEWDVTREGRDPFVLEIDDLTVKAWSKDRKGEGASPSLTGLVVNGSASDSPLYDHYLDFAAVRN